MGEAEGVGVGVAVWVGEGEGEGEGEDDGDSEGVGVGAGVGVGVGDGVGVGNSTSEGGWKVCTGMPVAAADMNRCQISAGIDPPYTAENPPTFRMEMFPRG